MPAPLQSLQLVELLEGVDLLGSFDGPLLLSGVGGVQRLLQAVPFQPKLVVHLTPDLEKSRWPLS